MLAWGLLAIVISFLEHNPTEVFLKLSEGQDKEQGGNMVAGGYKQWEQKVSSPDLPTRMIQSLIQIERASCFFPMGSVQYDPMLSGVKTVWV